MFNSLNNTFFTLYKKVVRYTSGCKGNGDLFAMNDEPLLIKVNEACKLMNIGRNTMYKLVKVKGFPAIIFLSKNKKKPQILIDKNQLPLWISRNYGTYKT